MARLSILGMLILIALVAVVLAMFVRLGDEAAFYVAGPILGSLLGARGYRLDRWAFVKGGAVGGLCQGLVALLVLKHGYPFQDPAMMTGTLFLAAMAVHLTMGLGLGLLLSLAFRQTLPRVNISTSAGDHASASLPLDRPEA